MPVERAFAVRTAAVAGRFYPAEPAELRRAVERYVRAADVPDMGTVRAVIAPHAGYQYSGPVAGCSYRALADLPDAEFTVFLLGPAHLRPVDGVGLSGAELFDSPLGRVPVATTRVSRLLGKRSTYRLADAAHAPEHCLEVQLPFLQVVLDRFDIVPMLLDEAADPRLIGADLAEELAADPHSLVVVSSDLSHYYPYDEAVGRDRAFLKAVVAGDLEVAGRGEACGVKAVKALMVAAGRLGLAPVTLAYRNSGDTGGDRRAVVGYGAVAYESATASPRQKPG